MTRLSLAIVIRVVRAWTSLYTTGLPSRIRDGRRAEIDSDLWEFQHDADRRTCVASAAHLLARLVRGLHDDLSWRADQKVRDGRSLTVRLATATVALVVSGAALFILDLMRARQLPTPPPRGAFVPAPAPPPVPPGREP